VSARAQNARGYRLRPAPRRRTQGRPSSRIHWDRLGRVLLVLVLFGVLLSYVNPGVNLIDAWRDSHTAQSDLQSLKREHSRVATQAASLNDPAAAAEEARRLGMVAPGEHSYVIRGLHH
jgi:cell division protein FtsB